MTNGVPDSNDWLQLAHTWQAQPVNLPALQRSTRWCTLRMYALMAVEIGVVLMIWSLAVYWQWIKPLPTLWQIWAWLWSVLAPVMTWFNIRSRRGTWRAHENDVRALLELRIRRAKANLTVIRYGDYFGPLGIVLGWLWNGLSVWLYPAKASGWQSFLGAIFVTVIVGGWMLICRRYARRERRKLAETESLLQDLN